MGDDNNAENFLLLFDDDDDGDHAADRRRKRAPTSIGTRPQTPPTPIPVAAPAKRSRIWVRLWRWLTSRD